MRSGAGWSSRRGNTHPCLRGSPRCGPLRRMMRVVIADDHLMVRAGVEAFIEEEPRMDVAASVGTVAEAEAACRELDPDVLVSDYHMPDGDGLTLCARLEAA